MTWEELAKHDLVVYSTEWCPDCKRLEKYLDEQNLSYRKIDIDADADAADYLQKQTGRTAIPFVQVDEKCMIRGWHADKPGKWDEAVFLEEVQEGLGSN